MAYCTLVNAFLDSFITSQNNQLKLKLFDEPKNKNTLINEEIKLPKFDQKVFTLTKLALMKDVKNLAYIDILALFQDQEKISLFFKKLDRDLQGDFGNFG